MSNKKHNKKKGFITLISVLVVGAVGTAITLSVILLGIGTSRTSLATEQASQARSLANACAERALYQIRFSAVYVGSENISLGFGSCAYTVTNSGGSTRTITVSGTVGSVVRKLSIAVSSVTPLLTVSSWQEVSD